MAETLVFRPVEPARHRRRAPAVVALLPALVAVAAAVSLLLATDTPVPAMVRYGAYLLFAVLLPGTLVHRWLRGRDEVLVADLALGAATGLALELLAWAACTALGWQRFLWAWPGLVVLAMLSVPSGRRELRQLWSRAGDAGLPVAAGWVVALAFSFLTATTILVSMWRTPLPPAPNAYYPDLYWHLSIAAELTRQVPPEVPQVAGRTLHYHWFSGAHLAASSLISGVDLPTVLLRLWLLPVVATVLGLLVAVSRRVSGLMWPGAIAAVLAVAPALFSPWRGFPPVGVNMFSTASPSQIFGLIFLLLAADVLVHVVRGRRLRGGWVVLGLALVAASGSKSAVLPVLIGGSVCALVVNVRLRRHVRRTAAALVLAGVVVVASSSVLAGGSAGGGVRVLGLLAFLHPWKTYLSPGALAGTGGLVLPGLDRSTALAAALIVAALLGQYIWVLLGAAPARRDTEHDPALWLLTGSVLAGLAALLLVDHPAAGQLYFFRTALPLATVLAGWGFAVALRNAQPAQAPWSRTARWSLLGAAAGIATALVARRVATAPSSAAEVPASLGWPMVVPIVAVALGWAGWRLAARRSSRMPGYGGATLASAVLAGCLLAGPQSAVSSVSAVVTKPAGPLGPRAVSTAETQAAQWLSRQAGDDDVVATNVRCIYVVSTPRCDARAFWVSGLTQRRVLVEGWAYTDEAQAAHGRDGRRYTNQPFDDPALLALNDRALASPTPDILAELRDRHGVRWIFADRRAGPVSALLARYAELRLTSGPVSVFRLRPSGSGNQ